MISTKHVRGLTASYKKRVGLSELRLSRFPWVSERTRLVIRRVLNTFPLQDNREAIDDVRNALGTFDALLAITSKFHV
jgi:hypothetical protein